MKKRSRGKEKRDEVVEKGPFTSKGSRLLEAEWRASGVSMSVFAKRINVHRTTVFRWISGAVRPDRDNIFHMEKVLSVPARSWND